MGVYLNMFAEYSMTDPYEYAEFIGFTESEVKGLCEKYNAMKEYIKIRELPTGKGSADIVYIPKKHSDKPAMIVELKYDKSAQGAINQIKEKNMKQILT